MLLRGTSARRLGLSFALTAFAVVEFQEDRASWAVTLNTTISDSAAAG